MKRFTQVKAKPKTEPVQSAPKRAANKTIGAKKPRKTNAARKATAAKKAKKNQRRK